MNKKSCSKKFYVERNKYRDMVWEKEYINIPFTPIFVVITMTNHKQIVCFNVSYVWTPIYFLNLKYNLKCNYLCKDLK